MTCTHDWFALSGWFARYRCRDCGVLGYRALVTADIMPGEHTIMPTAKKPEEIVPYICRVPDCGQGAVTRDGKSAQHCREHERARKAVRAEYELKRGEKQKELTVKRRRARELERSKAEPAAVAVAVAVAEVMTDADRRRAENRRAMLLTKGFKLPPKPNTEEP